MKNTRKRQSWHHANASTAMTQTVAKIVVAARPIVRGRNQMKFGQTGPRAVRRTTAEISLDCLDNDGLGFQSTNET
jgi:hypothetical protein